MACRRDGDEKAAKLHLEAALALRPGDPVALRMMDEQEEDGTNTSR